MKPTSKITIQQRFCCIAVVVIVLSISVLSISSPVNAVAPAVTNPKSSSVGLEGTISSAPPGRAATISSPVAGRSFTILPVTVTGLCPEGILVKVFSNNIFVGSASCSKGSYSLQVDLFSGTNELIARNYDNLDQAGPDSNTVAVNFNDNTISAFEQRVSLTSSYAKKGANPGDTLSWPIVISGGNGPYALSIDWGDGKTASLVSVPFVGPVNINHVYDSAGVYRVVVKAVDSAGGTAYLQLIGVANGAVSSTGSTDASGTPKTVTIIKYSVIPAIVALPLILFSFLLGRKYELKALRQKIESSTTEEYN